MTGASASGSAWPGRFLASISAPGIWLAEERPYWEAYFELLSIKDAHARSRCRHESGEEYWACANCNCTEKLEQRLAQTGRPFREGSG